MVETHWAEADVVTRVVSPRYRGMEYFMLDYVIVLMLAGKFRTSNRRKACQRMISFLYNAAVAECARPFQTKFPHRRHRLRGFWPAEILPNPSLRGI